MDGRRLQPAREPFQVSARLAGLQAYQVILYSKALHPELFTLRDRRTVKRPGFELEAWIMQGRHLLRFERSGFCACELLTDQERSPASGVVCAFLCAGERDFEHTFDREGISYMTTVQTETLGDNIYDTTYVELLDLARQSRGLVATWEDEHGKGLSVIDIQDYAREVHAQCYHMLPLGGLVVRTQSIFEHE